MAEKTTDHNGKEVKQSNGKNIRVSEIGWDRIRLFCAKNSFKMGRFTEESTIEAMKRFNKRKRQNIEEDK